MRALDLFDKGQDWESALALAEALKLQFSTVTFEYKKLRSVVQGVSTQRTATTTYDNLLLIASSAHVWTLPNTLSNKHTLHPAPPSSAPS